MPLTRDRPKCLLPVADETTLLGWQLGQLAEAGVDDVVVVSGFGADKVEEEVGRRERPRHARTLFNPAFDQMDNLGSAWRAREEMDREFVLINGDTLFTANIVQRLRSAPDAPVTTAISKKREYDEDDMKVALRDGSLQSVGKHLDPAEVDAESIGMIRFRGDGPELFREAADRAVAGNGANRGRYYLSLVDAIAKTRRVAVLETEPDAWTEVDFPEDLERARQRVQTWMAVPGALK